MFPSCAQAEYLPTLAGNTIHAAAFGLLLITELRLGIKYKTWGFMTWLICDLFLRLLGCWQNHAECQSIYLVSLTIAPAFLKGALYLCLSHIIIVYGHKISRFSPHTYAVTFMTSDFVSLVLQSAGGGIAATAGDHSESETGRAIMVVGAVFQDACFVELRGTKKFTWFQCALGAAVVLIFIRSQGFGGPIANNEVSFMILEGPMNFLAVLVMTVLHPGIAFGGKWSSVVWPVKPSRTSSSTMSSSYMEIIHLQQRNEL
ncbi:RTA1 like protein-domain-containing protein [Mariannaea sp. PMI_226]|nr:RTA1 like protein-domain-containing protein [Mariannaea sp. PMI_226]